MKKSRGFSYIEVIIAMALFAIAMLAVIPVLSQAGRNMVFAEEAYTGHFQAQRIMLIVRDALIDDANPQARVAANVSDVDFSVWVLGRGEQEFHTIYNPDADARIYEKNIAMGNRASVIVVVVWDADGRVSGRAVGMVYT